MKKLADILKSKGVGPLGSKSLSKDDLLNLSDLMVSNEESIITRATLLTAFLLLENTVEEANWLKELSRKEDLPEPLWQLLPSSFKKLTSDKKMTFGLSMHHKILQTKELNPQEVKKLVKFWLNKTSDTTVIASTLEGLRLKRETFGENLEIWSSLLNKSTSHNTQVSEIVDIADIYNGQNRFPLLSPALACLLASADMHVSLHGTFEAPPKFGVSVNKILQAAEIEPCISLKNSAKCLETVGFSYTDQSVSFPELYALLNTGIEMVKRPCLATFEKLLSPLKAKNSQELICGYTHKGYKDLLPHLAQKMADSQVEKSEKNNSVRPGQITSFVNLKGLEGSPMTPGNRATNFARYMNQGEFQGMSDGVFQVEQFEIDPFQIELDKERTPGEHLAMNIKAMREPDSIESQQLHYYATVVMSALDPQVHPAAIARTLKSLIIHGEAYAKWQEFRAFHQQLKG